MSAFGSGVDGGVGVEGTDWFPAGVSVLCAALVHALKANVLKSMAVHIHTCKIFLFIKPPLWLAVNNKKLADDNFQKEICQSIVFFLCFFYLYLCGRRYRFGYDRSCIQVFDFIDYNRNRVDFIDRFDYNRNRCRFGKSIDYSRNRQGARL